jgi:hypothetical protein
LFIVQFTIYTERTSFCSYTLIENRNKQTLSLNGVSLGKEKPMELGMGIEPIYNSSAGCRLNHSATPAL